MKYPLLLKPIVKDYIWGGQKLLTEFGFAAAGDTAAEGWMLCCHKDGTNTVLNGEYAGQPLDKVLEKWGYHDHFPILIKFIDAKQKLSVQVHPNNEYALKNEGEYGKTEMWYVVDCKQGARLAYGFTREIAKAEFKARIESNTLDEVINYVPVKKGDVFFITAGTLHAIGEDILIAEIQQNSNTTYRISDYGRLGKDGKPRELHIDKALEVTKTEMPTHPYGNVGETISTSYGMRRILAECEYFKTEKLTLCTQTEIYLKSGFASLIVLSGEVKIEYAENGFFAKKGDSIFIPNDCRCTLSGKAELIYTQQ